MPAAGEIATLLEKLKSEIIIRKQVAYRVDQVAATVLEMRDEVDDLIRDVWDELDFAHRKDKGPARRRQLREWGVVFRQRKQRAPSEDASQAPQEGEQIGHLRDADDALQPFRHKGNSGATQCDDLLPGDGMGRPGGIPECDRSWRLLRDHTEQRTSVASLHGIRQGGGSDFAVGIEDVDEDLIGVPMTDGGEVGSDVVACLAGAVTDGAGGGEDGLTAS